MTMNSAESLNVLFNVATSSANDIAQKVQTAELMREVGLKCIGFNGVFPPSIDEADGGWRLEVDHVIGSSND